MKRFLLILTSAWFLVGCGDATKEYNARATRVADSIITYSAFSEYVAGQYTSAWGKAISNSKDFNDALRETRSGMEGMITRLGTGKAWIDSAMRTLNEPPEKAQEAHRKIMDVYGKYTQYHELATSPTGSLLSYRQRTEDLSGELVKAQNELKVMGLISPDTTKGK